jgi:transcriptional regulator GlxA family with amidase domain
LSGATGESPKQFIDRIRFEMARTSLETSAKSVTTNDNDNEESGDA